MASAAVAVRWILQRYIITSAICATWTRFTEVRRTCRATSVNFQLRVCSIIPPVSAEEESVRASEIQNQLVFMEAVGHQSQSNRWISGCILNQNIRLLSLLCFLHVPPLLTGNATVLHINKLLQKCRQLYADEPYGTTCHLTSRTIEDCKWRLVWMEWDSLHTLSQTRRILECFHLSQTWLIGVSGRD